MQLANFFVGEAKNREALVPMGISFLKHLSEGDTLQKKAENKIYVIASEAEKSQNIAVA